MHLNPVFLVQPLIISDHFTRRPEHAHIALLWRSSGRGARGVGYAAGTRGSGRQLSGGAELLGAADVQLRVAIEKKGRPRHVVSLSDESEEGDVVFEDSGITIAVAAIQTSMLRGATIDFVSDGTAGRFEVTNPNLAQLSMDRLMRERAEQRAARGAGVDDSGEERKR